MTAPFHIFSNLINHHHPNSYTLQPSYSIQDLHVAFPNFVSAVYFQIKCSSCGCKASAQGHDLYAAVSSVSISSGYILYYLLYHASELLKCFYRVHVIRIIELQLLVITSQFKPWVC